MYLLILAVAIFLPAVSNANCETYNIKNNVIVFGGAGSTTPEMENCYPSFLTYSNDDGGKHVQCLAQQIERTSVASDQPFVIVGHSSGAAHAQRLIQALSKSGKSKVRLVLLEGFAIEQNQGVQTSCWYAKHGLVEGMNASSMKTLKACTDRHVYEDQRAQGACTNPLCLHISLVNLGVPNTVVDKNTAVAQGLKTCSRNGNTEWLKPDSRALLTTKAGVASQGSESPARAAQ